MLISLDGLQQFGLPQVLEYCQYIKTRAYNKFTNLHIHKFTSKSHSQTNTGPGQKTFLLPSADNQIRNYDRECSYLHPSLSTLKSKGLSRSKMKW